MSHPRPQAARSLVAALAAFVAAALAVWMCTITWTGPAAAQSAADSAAGEPEPAPVDTALSGFDDGFEPLPEADEEWQAPLDIRGAVRVLPSLHYNRVDEWTPGIRFGYYPDAGWTPRFEARLAFALGRDNDEALYSLEVAQPFLSGRRAYAGVTVNRFTASDDEWRVNSVENALASIFFRYDYRDYYQRDGVAWFLAATPIENLRTGVRYVADDLRSLEDLDPDAWSIFRQRSAWRPNPAIEDGELRAISGEAVYTFRIPYIRNWDASAALEFESAGGELGGDLTYSRYIGELRGSIRLGERANFAGRLRIGTTGAGTLPPQREFAVGGISTLRAHPFKHRRGDHMFLWNVEAGVRVVRGRQRTVVKSDVQVFAFLDVADAWEGAKYDVRRRRMLADAGLGLATSDGRIRVYVAADMREVDRPLHWTLRLGQPF